MPRAARRKPPSIRSDFGMRLSASMEQYGPVCIGIDPHRKVLRDWGYNADAQGAEMFSMRMLQGMRERAAAVKFQTPLFERYGSQGFEALERVLYAARQMEIITIVDCLHGGLPTTVSALADAYFHADSPLLADAITLLPYYGVGSLSGLVNEALDGGHGVFIASFTANQQGANMQTAIRQGGDYHGRTVAYGIAASAQKFNRGIEGMGSAGLIVGVPVSRWFDDPSLHPEQFSGPILSSGDGWQGANKDDLTRMFTGTRGNVLVTVSRVISSQGPDIAKLSQAAESVALDAREALFQATGGRGYGAGPGADEYGEGESEKGGATEGGSDAGR